MTQSAHDTVDQLVDIAREQQRAYAGEHERPLAGYVAAMGTYAAVVAGLAAAGRAFGRPLPERIEAGDIVLVAVATHKASRMLAKETVTSPLRAPFTRFRGRSGEAELAEEVRGSGLRRSVGELVTCPFCLAQWVATGLTAGLVLAPRATRLVATVFAARAGSDVLQLAYAALEEKVIGPVDPEES